MVLGTPEAEFWMFAHHPPSSEWEPCGNTEEEKRRGKELATLPKDRVHFAPTFWRQLFWRIRFLAPYALAPRLVLHHIIKKLNLTMIEHESFILAENCFVT